MTLSTDQSRGCYLNLVPCNGLNIDPMALILSGRTGKISYREILASREGNPSQNEVNLRIYSSRGIDSSPADVFRSKTIRDASRVRSSVDRKCTSEWTNWGPTAFVVPILDPLICNRCFPFENVKKYFASTFDTMNVFLKMRKTTSWMGPTGDRLHSWWTH